MRFTLLMCLAEEADGRVNTFGLSERLGVKSRANLSIHRRRLVEAGLIEDHGTALVLTEAGLSAINAVNTAIARVHRIREARG